MRKNTIKLQRNHGRVSMHHVQVIKCDPNRVSQKNSNRVVAPSRGLQKERVLCVTVQRRQGGPGFKASLHVCKRTNKAVYEVRKTYRLKNLVRLEAFGSARCTQAVVLMFFGGRMLTGKETKLVFECTGVEARSELIGILYSFSRSHEHVSPELVGISKRDLGVYGEGSDDEDESTVVSHEEYTEEDGAVSQPEVARGEEKEHGGRDGDDRIKVKKEEGTDVASGLMLHESADTSMALSSGKVSRKQSKKSELIRRQITRRDSMYNVKREAIRADALLDALSEGASSLEDACVRISQELRAVEDANVHELLESSQAVKDVNDNLFSVMGYLDDVEETVGIFDLKLRHLRESMAGTKIVCRLAVNCLSCIDVRMGIVTLICHAAIEESSEYLENHARSNRNLLEAINDILQQCSLDPEIERFLVEEELMLTKYVCQLFVHVQNHTKST